MSGCTDEARTDGRDDTFLSDGKSDTGGIAEGTPEAAAVLFVANSSSRAELGDEVGLAAKPADNIVAVRDGDDGVASTADDAQFRTLAQLDAVPYVGPIAFAALLDYARANDLVGDVPAAIDDPFDPASCTGTPMTQAEAAARWSSGQGVLGSYQLAFRERSCTNGVCGDWTVKPVTYVDWPQDASGILSVAKSDGEMRLYAKARSCDEILGSRSLLVGTSCDGIGHDIQCYSYNVPDACRASTDNGLWVNGYGILRLAGTLTNSCARLVDKRTSISSISNKTYELESVLFVRF